MKKILKDNYKFIFIFFFFLIFNLIISPLNMDEVWSFGFSNNLYRGLIPYKDFNMVITPFHAFIMSIPMYLFGNSMFVYHLFHTIIITIFFIILDKLIDKKIWIIFPFLIFPMNIVYPNYNFFLLFLFILLIYTEKNNCNDYIIGLILGVIFLTKQSVGLVVFLTTFYYIKDKKFIKRLVGFLIPCFIFFIYLVITNSIVQFIDLCLLGLVDFGHNGSFNITVIFTVVFLFILILYLIRDYKNIYIYYFISFISISIPLFDYYHFLLFFVSFLIFIFMEDKIKIKYEYIGLIIGIMFGIYSYFYYSINFNYYPNKIKHFEYRYLDKDYITYTDNTLKLLDKYDNNVVFIGMDGYYFKIIRDININYLDLINYGNYGYHGSLKLLSDIDDFDGYFFISKGNLGQTDKGVVKYIKNNYSLVEDTKFYSIYS